MPLTDKGKTILKEMRKRYGKEKGERVFYASKNKGTITGVDEETKEKSAAFIRRFRNKIIELRQLN